MARKAAEIVEAGADLHVVILAGGRGTRFWPLGRAARPKQFLPILSDKSMIEETVDRISPIVPLAKTYFVADRTLAPLVRKLFPGVPRTNILVEPEARNTAPALLLATAEVYLKDPRAVVAVLPADHWIRRPNLFLKKLLAAAEAARKEKAIVIFGIPPTYPATGYGYIRQSLRPAGKYQGEEAFAVRRFLEKPSLEKARKFVASGNCLWNSGMFLWTPETFVAELASADPAMHEVWKLILDALRKKDKAALADAYGRAEMTSIDYALLEKSRRVLVFPGDFGWSDIGSWSALLSAWEGDAKGNAAKGEAMFIDCERCLAYNPDKLTVVIGAKDMIVVDTGDALLVCPSSADQRVKEAVALLKKAKKNRCV